MPTTFWARTDSNSANNPALNLNGDDAVEISFIWKSPTSDVGDVILEQNGGSADPDSLVEINGAEYSFIFEYTGTLPTQNRDGANQVPEDLEGENVYLITIVDYPAVGESTRMAFLPDADPSEAEMNDFGKGAIDIQALDTTPPATPVCFTRDVMIATPDGERAVQSLKAGDKVLTASGDVVILRWVAKSRYSLTEMRFAPSLRPVCIPKDYFGPGAPHSELWLSQQHRIALSGWEVELNLGLSKVFARAKHLIDDIPYPEEKWASGIEYYHLLFDRHEVILSNGLASESFFPGDEAKKTVAPQVQAELEKVLQTLAPEDAPVLPTASEYEAMALAPVFYARPVAA